MNRIFITMEYFPHGDLERFLDQQFSELETSRIASQVAKGLGFMHQYNFIHRDLKPGVSDYSASLVGTDFFLFDVNTC